MHTISTDTHKNKAYYRPTNENHNYELIDIEIYLHSQSVNLYDSISKRTLDNSNLKIGRTAESGGQCDTGTVGGDAVHQLIMVSSSNVARDGSDRHRCAADDQGNAQHHTTTCTHLYRHRTPLRLQRNCR